MNRIPKWMGIQQTLSSCFEHEGAWVKAWSVYDFNGWSHERIKNVLRQRSPVKRDLEGPQNSNLSYLDSFKVFERVLQFQPQKLSGEESDLKIGTAAMESLLCLCTMSKNQMAVTFSSLRRKGTWSEGQKPKGWFVVWLCADPSGCWNQINLWKGCKGFLGLTLSFRIK